MKDYEIVVGRSPEYKVRTLTATASMKDYEFEPRRIEYKAR